MLRAIGKKVVAIVDAEDKTAGGIIIPRGTQTERTILAKVISVGGDVDEVGVGDIVLVDKFATHEATFMGSEYVIFDWDRVYCVVEKNDQA